MRIRRQYRELALIMFCTPLMFSGCGCERESPPAATEALKAQPYAPAKPSEPLIKKAEIVDWCKEHGVPESICTRCNAKLIEGFKNKGDWCNEHSLPESQCIDCHPELKAKFEAMKPKQG